MRPSRQRSQSSRSLVQVSGSPDVPVSKKMRLPCLTLKNLKKSRQMSSNTTLRPAHRNVRALAPLFVFPAYTSAARDG